MAYEILDVPDKDLLRGKFSVPSVSLGGYILNLIGEHWRKARLLHSERQAAATGKEVDECIACC